MSTTSGMFGNNGGDTTTYFAAKEANDTASILLAKSKSFYNVLEANAYLEKLTLMWRT
jgi:hypothetical protein